MKKIKLYNSNKFALVDDSLYEGLNKYRWCLSNTGYAVRGVRDKSGYKKIQMHRVINRTPNGMITDHINRDKLDNRLCNLRTATASQNQFNRKKQHNNTSGYTGIRWNKNDKTWVAYITLHGKRQHIGSFDTQENAIKARQEAVELTK